MKINTNIFLSAALLLGGLAAKAQQIPLYSNYFFAPYIYNPSMSGTDGSTRLSIMHRRQWTGIEGSPETSAFALDGALNEEKVGYSVYGFSDNTHIINRLGIYGNYAYHLQVADNSSISFGIGAGYLNNAIDVNNINAQQAGDVFTFVNDNDRGVFDINAGLRFQIADFSLGAAAPQLLGHSVEYLETTNRKVDFSLLRHYIFNAQYDFKFDGDKRVLSPMVMVRAAENVPIQVDAGAIFEMEELGYIGAMYRSDYAVTGNLGVHLTEQLTIGYAYDFSLNEYSGSFGTSHEFMLSYKFGSDKRNERLENEIKRLKERQRRDSEQTEEMVDEKLEEFKDEFKRDMKKDLEDAAQEAAAQAADGQSANDNGGNNNRNAQNNNGGGNNAGRNNNQQGNNANMNRANTGQNNNAQGAGNNNQNFNNAANNNGGGMMPSQISAGSPGYYLTAGVFSNKANADRRLRELSQQGLDAGVFQDPGNYFYYVFIRKFDSYQGAQNARSSQLNGSYNGELWIKVVE